MRPPESEAIHQPIKVHIYDSKPIRKGKLESSEYTHGNLKHDCYQEISPAAENATGR